MGRIEHVKYAGINAYNRIIDPKTLSERNRDYPWGTYDTKGFIQDTKSSSDGVTSPKTAEELESEITARFGEGDYIYAACEKKGRKGLLLVMRLLEKKVE